MKNISIKWELIKGLQGIKITRQSTKKYLIIPRDLADDFTELIPWICIPF